MTNSTASAVAAEEFVSFGGRDNFYQTCAFIPMSFALVTTVHETGETGIGPHALVAPFGISKPYSLLLISRSNSATAGNIRRTGKCAFNYIEFDRERLTAVSRLGYPGQTLEDKQKAMPFTLQSSPSSDKQADPDAPKIIGESFQIFECTWDHSFSLDRSPISEGEVVANHFVMQIDHILMRRRFQTVLEDGGALPSMPVFYGFRANGGFWFAEHSPPFPVPLPKVGGLEQQGIFYLANRLDEHVRFTREACAEFSRVPQPFLKTALLSVIVAARTEGIALIDTTFARRINSERKR